MAEHQLPKLDTRVRFPSPAPIFQASKRLIFEAFIFAFMLVILFTICPFCPDLSLIKSLDTSPALSGISIENYHKITARKVMQFIMKRMKTKRTVPIKVLYKKWWFWLIVVIVAISPAFGEGDDIDQPIDNDIAQIEEPAEGPGSGSVQLGPNENDPKDIDKSLFNGYRMLIVDGGDLSGHREPNAAVDIGFGDREYWAFTNEYGQLVRVVAKEIIPQNDSVEPINSDGRYYDDEAKVPGTELPDYDEGHIIADSLGGVSNAYNITPQNSVLNRHGAQAYMEKVIRDAGGCTDFEAIITYPNTETQIPSHYHYTYKINGNVIIEDFDNIDPDEANRSLIESQKAGSAASVPAASGSHDISKIDTNGNGKISIAEAKAAGFKMPITRDHWLYQYMDDRDGDGLVGE